MRRKHHRRYQGRFTRLASRYRSLFTFVLAFLVLLFAPGFKGTVHAQDTVRPVFVSASTDGAYVTITFSEEVFVSPLVRYVKEWSGAPLPLFLKASFDVSINGREIFQNDAVTLSGTDLTLQLAYFAGSGDEVRVAYNNIFARNAGGLLVDAAGNTVPYFSNQTVQNNATGDGSNLIDGAVLIPGEITIPEGRSGTYTVALPSRPSENVTVNILPYAIVRVAPTQLTFTPDNWDDPQTVRVSTDGDNDSIDAWAAVLHQIVGDNNANWTFIKIVVDDQDTPLVVSGNTSTDYAEDGTSAVATYSVANAAGPITWSLFGYDKSDFSISSAGVLTFNTPPDHENPADSNRDNVYQVTIHASDGASTGALLDVAINVTEVDEPTVSSLAITSDPGVDATYAVGEEIQITVTFSETMVVTETPQLTLKVGSEDRTANYQSGTGAALVFAYEVADGDEDTDGVSIEANRLSLNGGTIQDGSDNDALLDHDAVGPQADHKVDGVKPQLAATGGAVVDGTMLTLIYDEPLDGNSTPASGDFTVSGGDHTRTVTGVRVNGSGVELTLDVGAEHEEAGIRVSYTPGMNPIRDVPGNDARGLSSQSVTNTTGAPNTAPQITSPGSFDVPENQALARRLTASDADEGDEVTGWEIVGGADQSQFTITTDTGELSFRTAPDFEAPGDNEYEVTVEVRSGAGARELEAEQTFTVRVTDEREPPGIPEAPTFSEETAESLTVNWSEPDNTGPAITDYDVRYREKGTVRFTDGQHAGPGLSLTLDDLEPGTAYEVQVRATNDEGTSDWSESGEGMTVTPLTVPMTTDLPPPVESAFAVRFSFSETVVGFTSSDIVTRQEPPCTDSANNPVSCNPTIAALQTTDDRIFTTAVTPRTDQVAHNYTLRITVPANTVTSVVGNKPNEAASLDVRIAPPGVTVPISSIGLRANSDNGQVTLRWSTPANSGGAAIVRYEYRWGESGGEFGDWMSVAPSARSATVRGLTNGTEYTFEVRPANALGYGSMETTMATPVAGGGGFFPPPSPLPGKPSVPTVSAATPNSLTVEWTEPENTGTAITDYDVQYREFGSGGFTDAQHEGTARTATLTGLSPDTVYEVQVRATNAAGTGAWSESGEGRTSLPQPGDRTYYFPHLAVGEGWQTTLTYINYSPDEVSCRTEFLSDQGTPLLVSFADRGTVPSRTDVLQPGESVHEETNVELSAPRVAGWARTICTGPVKASLLYRQFKEGVPTGEAGVNATTVPATRFVTFAEQGEGQPGTGVAYANPSDTEAVITFTVRDADGETRASVDQNLSPGGHGAQNMQPLFGLPGFTGSLEVTSTEPIVTLSINAEANPVFSSLPPGELDAAAQGPQQMTTYYFPHLAVGDKYQTTITYINYSSEEVTCQTEFLSDHGSPLMVSFADQGTVVSRPDVLPPGGSVHQETNVALSAPLAPGWARATCTGPVKASLLFRLHNSEGVPIAEGGVNAATVPATRFITFAEQGEGKPGTGVAYANPSDTSAMLTFTAKDADGETLASVAKTLLPGGHDAQNMALLFGLSSFTGSLEVTSTAPIVSLSINAEAAPVFSSLPPGEVDLSVVPATGREYTNSGQELRR